MTFTRTDSGSRFLFGTNSKAVGDKVPEGGQTLTSISFCLEAKRLLKQLSKQSHLLLLVGDGTQREIFRSILLRLTHYPSSWKASYANSRVCARTRT